MAIASNFPAIRPSLNLDFANSKALDPRISFSRASAASYYDGKTVAKAEENLLLNSAILATQSVATRAEPYTLSFIGTGTVTLSGTSTAGPLVGTGAANRVSLTFTPTAGTLTLTVNGTVEQAQLEARFVATAYTPTTTQPITNYIPALQTAPAGFPRFDHNPVTGESLGLLVEEQRTNLAIYSEFQTGGDGVGLAKAAFMFGPSGAYVTATAYGHESTTTTYRYRTISVTAGVTYTLSVYVKFDDGGPPSFSGNVTAPTNDFAMNVVGVLPVTSSYVVTALGNGLYRVSASATPASDNASANSGIIKYGSNTSRTFKTTGWQLEVGAFPTSYIKTEASQVTRASDSAQMTGANFSSWYRQDEGTLFLESINEGGVAGGNFGMSDGTNSNRLWVQNDTRTSVTQAYVMKESILQSSLTLPGVVVNTSSKVAMAYKANYLAATRSGFASVTDNIASIPIVNKALFNAIGQETAATSSGWIRIATYYPKRLTDAQLQALTA